jgi:subtilisin family serine protease
MVTLVVAWSAVVGASPARAVNDQLYDKQWGLQKIGAKAAWDAGLMGDGIDIAIIDSGVHLRHQDLVGRFVPGRNFIDPAKPPQDDQCDDPPTDTNPDCNSGGHGTHVAGIAAAGIDDGGSVGVAPRARIMPVKVIGSDGTGTFNDAAAAIRWATDNGAEVLNLSLGADLQGVTGTPTVLNDAVRYAWSKGAICVFAAGNSFVLGSGFSNEPALVVSATDRQDNAPDFSSGVGEAKWGLAAPGGGSTLDSGDPDIWSTVWTSDSKVNTYATKRGTSMSSPFVAGAAAVLRGAGLTPQQTVDRLLATAKDLGAAGRDTKFGSGRVDLAKAIVGLSAPAGAGTSAGSGGSGAATTSPPGAGTATTARSAARRSTTTLAPVAAQATETTVAPVDSTIPANDTTTSTSDEPTVVTLAARPPTAATGEGGASGLVVAIAMAVLVATGALTGVALVRRRRAQARL